jgi:exodeoxyribonuclease VIII
MTTYAAYAALPGDRWSDLKHMNDGPRSYRMHMDAPDDGDTDAMAFGRAAHVAVFEPDMLPLQFAIWKGGTRRGKQWDEFLAANAGMEPLREADYLRAVKVRDAVHSHPEARKILRAKGDREKTIQWTDKDAGRACKSRLDFLTVAPPRIIDLKTTGNRIGDLRRFRNSAADLLYHGQFGMYRDGVKAALDIDAGARIIVAETSGAFEVAVLKVSSDELWAGSDLFHKLLERVAECEASDVWPFRYEDVQELDLPPWALPNDNDISDLGIAFEVRQGVAT